jgi:hypothetical protein
MFNYSIIAITETWLNPEMDSSIIFLDSYSLFRQDRSTRAGGVALYVKNDINVSVLECYGCDFTETLWIKILTKAGPYMFGVCYVPQTISEIAENSDRFIEYLDVTLESISQTNSKGLILVGDFNAKDPRWGFVEHSNALGQRLFNFVQEQNLFQLINEPTRITASSKSMLDLIITDVPDLFSDFGTLPPFFYLCDHCIIHGCISLHVLPNQSYIKEILILRNVNWADLNAALSSAPWDDCLTVQVNPVTA